MAAPRLVPAGPVDEIEHRLAVDVSSQLVGEEPLDRFGTRGIAAGLARARAYLAFSRELGIEVPR